MNLVTSVTGMGGGFVLGTVLRSSHAFFMTFSQQSYVLLLCASFMMRNLRLSEIEGVVLVVELVSGGVGI